MVGGDEGVARQRALALSKERDAALSRSRSPDLTLGLAQHSLADGAMLLGRVGEEPVLLVRIGSEFVAVGAHCTHRHAPLVAGLVVGRTIRCP